MLFATRSIVPTYKHFSLAKVNFKSKLSTSIWEFVHLPLYQQSFHLPLMHNIPSITITWILLTIVEEARSSRSSVLEQPFMPGMAAASGTVFQGGGFYTDLLTYLHSWY